MHLSAAAAPPSANPAPPAPASSVATCLRTASTWQAVQRLFGDERKHGSSDVAFALYRVGCLSCFMGAQARAGERPRAEPGALPAFF